MRESVGLMGLPAPALGYDGVVVVGQMPVKITDGILNLQGRTFDVSEDGEVTDENNRKIATIQNGRLVPVQPNQQQAQQPQAAPQGGQ